MNKIWFKSTVSALRSEAKQKIFRKFQTAKNTTEW